MLDLTLAQVEADLRELARTRGNDTGVAGSDNDTCVYAVDGEPCCIVGVIIHKHDRDLFELVARDYNDYSVGMLAERGLLPRSGDAVTLLRRVQRLQDLGLTWAEAVRRVGVEV